MKVNYRLLESIISRWQDVKVQLDELHDLSGIDKDIILEEWQDYEPENFKKFKMVCGDGSYNSVDYIDKYMILLSGIGLFYDIDASKSYKFNGFLIFIPFDVIVKKFVDDLASLIMAVLELKSIYLLSKEKSPDVVILDGSIRNLVMRFGPSHSKDMGQNWFYKGHLDEGLLEIIFNSNLDRIYEYSIWSYEMVKNFNKDDKFVYFAHLLYLEYLKILYDLLGEFRVISISKSFSPTMEGKIFQLITTPDIVLFNNYTKSVGYSKKILAYQNEMVKWQLPKPFENLKNIEIKFFYARFEKNYRVYKVEFVGDFTQNEILDIICPITILGYPYILKEAHNEVLIRDSDVQIVENYIESEVKEKIGIKLREELL